MFVQVLFFKKYNFVLSFEWGVGSERIGGGAAYVLDKTKGLHCARCESVRYFGSRLVAIKASPPRKKSLELFNPFCVRFKLEC